MEERNSSKTGDLPGENKRKEVKKARNTKKPAQNRAPRSNFSIKGLRDKSPKSPKKVCHTRLQSPFTVTHARHFPSPFLPHSLVLDKPASLWSRLPRTAMGRPEKKTKVAASPPILACICTEIRLYRFASSFPEWSFALSSVSLFRCLFPVGASVRLWRRRCGG